LDGLAAVGRSQLNQKFQYMRSYKRVAEGTVMEKAAGVVGNLVLSNCVVEVCISGFLKLFNYIKFRSLYVYIFLCF
jgi:hypothetical protein